VAAEGLFELIPAIDLKGGRCVRLQEGEISRSTEYGDDPVAMAFYWQDQGASRLHLVDLDGAFSGSTKHLDVARSIFRGLRIPVQFGGGLRTLEQIERVIELGARNAIVGTIAAEHPEIVAESVRRHADAIIVGIDARDGLVALRGWVDRTSIQACDLARGMKELGVRQLIYTDVARDGTMRGANHEETAALARASEMRVIASGGVSSEADVRALWLRRSSGIEGVILGRSLYEKTIDLRSLQTQVTAWFANAG
jgi:phosphoribosylformimino-5-aminoimidazole carboxamide ribotide isomerase